MQQPKILVFSSLKELGNLVLKWLRQKTSQSESVSIALSGGRTPQSLFEILSTLDWSGIRKERLKLFWGDERCVPPEQEESNYRSAKLILLDKLNFPPENIFRIRGEADPTLEVLRYRVVLSKHIPIVDGFPQFDLILLGLGEDGHTASIFPGNEGLFQTKDWCAVTSHPQTGQRRITLTGSLINHAAQVVFFVTGAAKADLITEIQQTLNPQKKPASFISPISENLCWIIDKGAANKT
jgi:6-phosphogluconolactonase